MHVRNNECLKFFFFLRKKVNFGQKDKDSCVHVKLFSLMCYAYMAFLQYVKPKKKKVLLLVEPNFERKFEGKKN